MGLRPREGGIPYVLEWFEAVAYALKLVKAHTSRYCLWEMAATLTTETRAAIAAGSFILNNKRLFAMVVLRSGVWPG